MDPTPQHAGLDRRSLLRKGVVAGAVAWTAPVVTTFGAPAFAQTGGSGPPPPPCDCDGHEISFIAVLLHCGSGYLLAKWQNGSWLSPDFGAGPCGDDLTADFGVSAWTAVDGDAYFGPGEFCRNDDDEIVTATFTLTNTGCTILGEVHAGSGQDCHMVAVQGATFTTPCVPVSSP